MQADLSTTEAHGRVGSMPSAPWVDTTQAGFSADAIPNAKLMNADGSPTALGQVYIGLPQRCR
jgi:hypothetical protein